MWDISLEKAVYVHKYKQTYKRMIFNFDFNNQSVLRLVVVRERQSSGWCRL